MSRGSGKKEVDAEEEGQGGGSGGAPTAEFELPVPVPVLSEDRERSQYEADANGHGNGAGPATKTGDAAGGSDRDIERGDEGEGAGGGKRGALSVEQGMRGGRSGGSGGGGGGGGDDDRKWPGNETFFCNGQCVTGPNYWGIVGTAFLILVPVAIFVALVAFPLFEELGRGPGAAVLLAVSFALPCVSMASLFCSGCMDPGIIPRHPPPANTEHIARTRNVEVNGHMVLVRYNETCNFYQPPRAHHCSVLNDCIERFDHYCPWVGTTIGKRNYRFYLVFVFSSSLLCIFTFACSACLVKARADQPDVGVMEAMRKEPAAMFMMAYVFIGFWFVGGLSGFHIYLLSKNQTTYENIRYSYDSAYSNPYNKGCLRNWAEVFCVPIPPSQIKFKGNVL